MDTPAARLWLGTSGYTNDDWRGLFYPANVASSDYLGYYAQHFPIVELNSSFYALPSERVFAGMVDKTRGQTKVLVKVHQSVTHDRTAEASYYQALLAATAPLHEAKVLASYLLQFPYSFRRDPDSRRYLAGCLQHLKGQPVALAFRHGSWDDPSVLKTCRDHDIMWVSCDYPQLDRLLEPQLYVTTHTAYLRLHGRNEATWWQAQTASERHNYRYSEQELRGWLEPLQHITQTQPLDDIYMIFANTTQGHALANMATVKDIASDYGLNVEQRMGTEQQGLF
ncbi:MAG: DUF72 domain-containing protein [Deinococcota bacterium]